MGKTKSKKDKKNKYIQIRVNSQEKKKILQAAKNNGFDSISAYMLWLSRKSR